MSTQEKTSSTLNPLSGVDSSIDFRRAAPWLAIREVKSFLTYKWEIRSNYRWTRTYASWYFSDILNQAGIISSHFLVRKPSFRSTTKYGANKKQRRTRTRSCMNWCVSQPAEFDSLCIAGHFPLLSFPPPGIWQLNSPRPREFAMHKQTKRQIPGG